MPGTAGARRPGPDGRLPGAEGNGLRNGAGSARSPHDSERGQSSGTPTASNQADRPDGQGGKTENLPGPARQEPSAGISTERGDAATGEGPVDPTERAAAERLQREIERIQANRDRSRRPPPRADKSSANKRRDW